MCEQCRLKPIYVFTNKRQVCARCFINYFQKKFLYTIRKFKMLNRNDIVLCENKKQDFRKVVLKYLLKTFSERSSIKITNLKTKANSTKKAIATTTDLAAYEIILSTINKNSRDFSKMLPVVKKTIKPLYLFLDKEVLLYAQLKKLKFEKQQIKKTDKIVKFIDELEKKHPEIKRAIVSGFLKLC